ncbi:hypothetical protein LZ318_13305 [Saccharopolyspora indica]|uniref:hypothetical protein n=1 Tax=Saccharopolyspora indica TaxID=1229659 RepID=UPI0022EB56B7|nr:hypothetical protein [Saccharopolyspora indica]MDA3647127.1 hypothetical protein [Saccharopolyspora indica]
MGEDTEIKERLVKTAQAGELLSISREPDLDVRAHATGANAGAYTRPSAWVSDHH